MPIIDATRRVKVARAVYDFAVSGGAVGDITLVGDSVPNGAIVTDVLLHVNTVPTSGGSATVAVKIQSSADLNSADAISGAPWSTTGAKRGDFTATTAPILLTADRAITATVATAALTAGKFTVYVMYV